MILRFIRELKIITHNGTELQSYQPPKQQFLKVDYGLSLLNSKGNYFYSRIFIISPGLLSYSKVEQEFFSDTWVKQCNFMDYFLVDFMRFDSLKWEGK